MTGKRLPKEDRAYWEARSGSHKDARTSIGTCPLMGKKIQLLPLRYGRVERLTSKVDTESYQGLQRPIGLRLIRDGFLYVVEETTSTLHEYRIENGTPVKLLWQGNDVTQDERSHATGESTLIFARNSVLHVAYSELQWTAAKCAHVISSSPDRFYFMQQVDLAKANCENGGKHLRVQKQIKTTVAELAEQPAPQCPTPDAPAEESQDYAWEHQPLFREAHIGELKDSLNALYQFDHLYLILEDSLGIMRDLAEEQDTVVGWIEEWTQRHNNEMRYVVGSYIDTLMTLGENNALRTDATSDLFEKTTLEQRTLIYDYINARNQWRWEKSQGLEVPRGENGNYSSMRGAHLRERSETVIAKRQMDEKHRQMVDALGEPLHKDLDDEIEALEDSSIGTLQGVGLGSRGIFDLVRHEEMQRYLKRERLHLKRWTERLDAITHDRTRLFILGEFHRSAWYFDPEHPEQLNNALATEYNCTRDLCRTDEALEKIAAYFHDKPFYVLPVFYGRLNLDFLRVKSGALIKLLDDMRGFTDGLADAEKRISDIGRIMGSHWSKSLQIEGRAHSLHQAVSATYIPAIALGMEKWLAQMQVKLETPAMHQQMESFKTFTNRGQRLGMLVALQQEGAHLNIASADDVEKFTHNFTRLVHLLEREEQIKADRKNCDKLTRKRMLSEEERYGYQVRKEAFSKQLLATRNKRSAVVRQLEDGITPTSTLGAGRVGVQLDISPENLAALNDETRRLRAGPLRGYGTEGTKIAALKSGFVPLLAVGLQVGNLREAWSTLNNKSREGLLSAKDRTIFFSVVTGFSASALSAYQAAHIAMVDKVLQSILHSGPGKSGMLFAIKSGKLGLSLGLAIAPMAFFGSLGTLIDNWGKWHAAFLTGTAGEKTGALTGVLGGTGNIGITGTLTAKAIHEGLGLSSDYLRAIPTERPLALANGWATRGSRFLHFSMSLTPLGLAFTALQLGGEALYNYSNLDDQQRWMIGCCWGVTPENWDWLAHSQKLAEATLTPYLIDKGLHRKLISDEPVRRLNLILPGLRLGTFNDSSLSWTALLRKSPNDWDAGPALSSLIHVISESPLIIELDIPDQWQGMQAQLELRLIVTPTVASQPLKANKGHLHYRVSLSPDIISSKPITASSASPAQTKSSQVTQITRDMLKNELK
ncbi:hypothetical protein NLO95_27470 [Pseudomonas syringae]|nr:hypothetical protein [Pseudomonas syringae]